MGLFGKKKTPEKLLAEAQKRETAETGQTQPKEQMEQIFNEGVTAYKGKDDARALSLFEKAAQQGNAAAQCNCGLMYYRGEGTAADKEKALCWFEKSAGQGYAEAQ